MTNVTAYVDGADRFVVQARLDDEGLRVWFADGVSGVVPSGTVRAHHRVAPAGVAVPDPHRVVVRFGARVTEEFPWDFLRGFCHAGYEQSARAAADVGRANLGGRVRERREKRGLSQTALAQAAGVGRVTLARVEAGSQAASLATLEALARALDLPIADLLAPRTR